MQDPSKGDVRGVGPRLTALGQALVGKMVLRHWPDNGGWWEAAVLEYAGARSQHKVVYDPDTPQVRYILTSRSPLNTLSI